MQFWDNINKAVDCLNAAIQNDGYAKHVRKVLRNTIILIGIAFRTEFEYGDQFKTEISFCLNFCANHLLEAFHDSANEISHIRGIVRSLKGYKDESNPFRNDSRWDSLLDSSATISERESRSMDHGGLVIANVYNITNKNKGFIFSRDVTGKQYYLHVSELKNGPTEWLTITNGQTVAMECNDDETPPEGKATRPKFWLLVD